MFTGRRKKYFIEYFTTDLATRTGNITDNNAMAIERIVGGVMEDAKARNLLQLDRPLGALVTNPFFATPESEFVRDFVQKTYTARHQRWHDEGVAEAEVIAYWDHGLISHLCYAELDRYFTRTQVEHIISNPDSYGISYESLDDGVHKSGDVFRRNWPIYGTPSDIHTSWDPLDRPLPEETRLWADQWRFRSASNEPLALAAYLAGCSSFNAAVRRFRGGDPAFTPPPGSSMSEEVAKAEAQASVNDAAAGPLDTEVLDEGAGSDGEILDEDFEDEGYDLALDIPDELRWPVPIRLNPNLMRPPESDSVYDEYVVLPCAREFNRRFQVPGILVVAHLQEPDQYGLQLCINFYQQQHVDEGAYETPTTYIPLTAYCVKLGGSGVTHRAKHLTPAQALSWSVSWPDLGLGLTRLFDRDAMSERYVFPWQTGNPTAAERALIRTGLQTVLNMIDRHLDNVEAIRNYEENWEI